MKTGRMVHTTFPAVRMTIHIRGSRILNSDAAPTLTTSAVNHPSPFSGGEGAAGATVVVADKGFSG